MALAAACVAVFASAADAARAPRKRVKPPECPQAGTRAVFFAKAVDGQSFTASDAAEIRLAGVLAAGAGGETLSGPQAVAARNALATALQAGPLTMIDLGRDRYGRTIAHLFAGEAPVAQSLLRSGAVRVAPDALTAPCAALLLQAENEARSAKAGHWGDGLFALEDAGRMGRRLGTFQIVEGEVVTASQTKGRAYINFGADYKKDFTVTVAPADMKAFRAAKLDVKKLAGKRVRVRGWVELYNGPEMEIASPAAIETLN